MGLGVRARKLRNNAHLAVLVEYASHQASTCQQHLVLVGKTGRLTLTFVSPDASESSAQVQVKISHQ